MFRKLATALFLVPLAVLLAAFAVANRQAVVISFDPFDQAHPAYVLSVPLFALILALLIGGVVAGGAASWLRQSKWRRRARLAQARSRELAVELERLKRSLRPVELPAAPAAADYQPRLTIPPPAA